MAAVLILAGLIILSVLVDRKVEAAERRADLENYIEQVCEPYNICPELVEAMIERESTWNPKAQNGDCMGLMQISGRWHKERMERLGVTDLLDPYDNILVGVDYLAELFGKSEDAGFVLMVYHGEKTAIERASSGEISDYADWILERSAELERAHGK